MKQYKLLKDLPDLASGVIFEHDGFREQYSYGNNSRSYHSYTIENNPEWFEEVKEKHKLYEQVYDILFSHRSIDGTIQQMIKFIEDQIPKDPYPEGVIDISKHVTILEKAEEIADFYKSIANRSLNIAEKYEKIIPANYIDKDKIKEILDQGDTISSLEAVEMLEELIK